MLQMYTENVNENMRIKPKTYKTVALVWKMLVIFSIRFIIKTDLYPGTVFKGSNNNPSEQ